MLWRCLVVMCSELRAGLGATLPRVPRMEMEGRQEASWCPVREHKESKSWGGNRTSHLDP